MFSRSRHDLLRPPGGSSLYTIYDDACFPEADTIYYNHTRWMIHIYFMMMMHVSQRCHEPFPYSRSISSLHDDDCMFPSCCKPQHLQQPPGGKRQYIYFIIIGWKRTRNEQPNNHHKIKRRPFFIYFSLTLLWDGSTTTTLPGTLLTLVLKTELLSVVYPRPSILHYYSATQFLRAVVHGPLGRGIPPSSKNTKYDRMRSLLLRIYKERRRAICGSFLARWIHSTLFAAIKKQWTPGGAERAFQRRMEGHHQDENTLNDDASYELYNMYFGSGEEAYEYQRRTSVTLAKDYGTAPTWYLKQTYILRLDRRVK